METRTRAGVKEAVAVHAEKGRKGVIMPATYAVFTSKDANRIVVYAKDVENITGRRERAARKILQRIRESYGKPKEALVTVKEFCRYMCFEEAEVEKFLLD